MELDCVGTPRILACMSRSSRKGAEDLFSLGRNGADIQLSLVLYISLESRQDKNWGQRDDGDPGQNDSLEPPHVSSAAGIVAGILLGR